MQTSNSTEQVASGFSRNELEALVAGNDDFVLGRLKGCPHISKQLIVRKIVDRILYKISTGKAQPFISASRQSGPNGIVLVEEAPWDTGHFGRRIGKFVMVLFKKSVDLKSRQTLIRRAFDSSPFEMISTRISLGDTTTVQAIEREGALLTDVLLTFRLDLSRSKSGAQSQEVMVTHAMESDSNTLAEIGRTVFTVDRFHNDPHFDVESSSDLYAKWVANSLNGLADTVLVARVHDDIAGFITCKIEDVTDSHKVGVIDLVGVAREFRRKGVGTMLVAAADSWFSERVRSVYVGTQGANSGATRTYENAGYRHVFSEATLHLWNEKPD